MGYCTPYSGAITPYTGAGSPNELLDCAEELYGTPYQATTSSIEDEEFAPLEVPDELTALLELGSKTTP